MNIQNFLVPSNGKKFQLRKFSPASTQGVRDEKEGV